MDNGQSLCNQWRINLRRDNYTPKPDHRVCSEHFEPDCYDVSSLFGKRKILKRTAVPTICKFPRHLQKKPGKVRPPPKDRSSKEPEAVEEVTVVGKNSKCQTSCSPVFMVNAFQMLWLQYQMITIMQLQDQQLK